MRTSSSDQLGLGFADQEEPCQVQPALGNPDHHLLGLHQLPAGLRQEGAGEVAAEAWKAD